MLDILGSAVPVGATVLHPSRPCVLLPSARWWSCLGLLLRFRLRLLHFYAFTTNFLYCIFSNWVACVCGMLFSFVLFQKHSSCSPLFSFRHFSLLSEAEHHLAGRHIWWAPLPTDIHMINFIVFAVRHHWVLLSVACPTSGLAFTYYTIVNLLFHLIIFVIVSKPFSPS